MPGLQYSWPNQSLVRTGFAGPGVSMTDSGTNPPEAHRGMASNNDVFTGADYASITASDAPNAAKLAGLGFYADPQTNWTTGQKITVNGFQFNWNGTAWAAGTHALMADDDKSGSSKPEGALFDPGDHTVAEVNEYLDANPDDEARVLKAERKGKARATLLGE